MIKLKGVIKMKTILIAGGILLVLWLGFLTIDRNGVDHDINRHDTEINDLNGRFDSLDDRYEMREDFISEENPIDKAEDEFDKGEDKLDRNINMPYEKDKTRQNTDLKPKDDNNANKPIDKETLKKHEDDDNELFKDRPQAFANESIVAFKFIDDYMSNASTEAFQLNLDGSLANEDSVVAFKIR